MTVQQRVPAARRAQTGRPQATSRGELEQVALTLFASRGFDDTTLEDIAAAAGIGRRTFFRYYGSKNDLVWGEFTEGLQRMRALLAASDPALPTLDALREAVLSFNALPPEQVAAHRARMELILRVPALQAHSTLRYAEWRRVVSDFVAARTGLPATDLLPQLAGHTLLAAAVTAYEQWLAQPGTDLPALLDAAVRRLGDGLSAHL